MKTLVCSEPLRLQFEDRPGPSPRQDHAIVKIKKVGICGTDLHAFEGTQPYFNYPRILGHELAGEVADANGAAGFEVGERVTLLPYVNCGDCIACRNGRTNCCERLQVLGVHTDGGMAEYISVPSRLLVHGEDLGYDHLAMVEPLAIGAHAVGRALIRPGEFVLVIGAGPIGIGAMQFARIAGATVIAQDTRHDRLEFCKVIGYADHIIDALSPDVMATLREITGGDMPAVIFDATGNVRAINSAFAYMSHAGRFVLIGLQKNDITFSHPEFHKREGTLMSSRNAVRADFEYVISCIKKGLVDPLAYITHRVGFGQIPDEMATWLDPHSGVIKALASLD